MFHRQVKMYLQKIFTNSICGCSKKCNSSISTERHKQIFENFYSLDWSLKNAFIVGQIIVSEIARKYTQSATSRQANTLSYYLPDEQGHLMKCAKPTLKTHCKSVMGKSWQFWRRTRLLEHWNLTKDGDIHLITKLMSIQRKMYATSSNLSRHMCHIMVEQKMGSKNSSHLT